MKSASRALRRASTARKVRARMRDVRRTLDEYVASFELWLERYRRRAKSRHPWDCGVGHCPSCRADCKPLDRGPQVADFEEC